MVGRRWASRRLFRGTWDESSSKSAADQAARPRVEGAAIPRIHRLRLYGGIGRLSVAHFLAALVALLVVTPFVEELAAGNLIEAVLMTAVLMTAVLAVGGRRRSLIAAVVLVTPALAGTWLHKMAPDLVPRSAGLASAIVFALLVIFHLMALILKSERVDSEVLCAAISTYLMLGLVWAMAYELLWRLAPESFAVTASADGKRTIDGFEALYFSFAALAPINDTDIVPVSNVARLLVMVEATVGMLYMGVLIARLVGIYSNEEASQES